MKQMSRRSFLIASLAATGAATLAACTPKESAPAPAASEPKVAVPTPKPKAAEKKITIRIQTPATVNTIDMVNKCIEEYMAANPGVEVISEETIYGEIATKTETGFISGTLQDIPYAHNRWYFINCYRGVYSPLDDYIESSPPDDLDDFFPLVMEANKFEGVQYSLPQFVHPGGNHTFLWNKTILEEAGVPEPEPDGKWTWDDLAEMAETCTNKDKGIFGLTMVVTAMHYFENISRCFGDPNLSDKSGWQLSEDGRKFQFESPVCEEVAKLYTRLVKGGVIPGPDDLIEGGLFIAGKQAFTSGGVSSQRALELKINDAFEVGWAVHPVGPKGRFGTCYSGNMWMVSSVSENPDVAWDVIKALTEKDISIWGILHGALQPGRKSAWLDSQVSAEIPAFPLSAQLIDDGIEPFPMPWNLRFTETNNVYANESAMIWNLERTYDEYAGTVNKKTQNILDLDRPPKMN